MLAKISDVLIKIALNLDDPSASREAGFKDFLRHPILWLKSRGLRKEEKMPKIELEEIYDPKKIRELGFEEQFALEILLSVTTHKEKYFGLPTVKELSKTHGFSLLSQDQLKMFIQFTNDWGKKINSEIEKIAKQMKFKPEVLDEAALSQWSKKITTLYKTLCDKFEKESQKKFPEVPLISLDS